MPGWLHKPYSQRRVHDSDDIFPLFSIWNSVVLGGQDCRQLQKMGRVEPRRGSISWERTWVPLHFRILFEFQLLVLPLAFLFRQLILPFIVFLEIFLV